MELRPLGGKKKEIMSASDTGPFGAKSVGESGLVATAAAIANAVYDAIGIIFKELPMTPERVLAALQNKEQQER